jgi:hypothetical protein
LGTISLSTAGRIQVNLSKKKPNGFEIPTPSRTYYLTADTETERHSWMETLEYTREHITKKGSKVCGGLGGCGGVCRGIVRGMLMGVW